MPHLLPLLILASFFACLPSFGQQSLRIIFYNVENLFHPSDVPADTDRPGLLSYKRFDRKINDISKVISSAAEWNELNVVALAEVSSEKVMDKLKRTSAFEGKHFHYFITEQSDKRGMRLAAFVDTSMINIRCKDEYRITLPNEPEKTTRSILHLWGHSTNHHSIDIFVCHFPSRYGGEKESETFRFTAAQTLRQKCDSVFSQRKDTHIIILGDFNDTPQNKSIRTYLKALPYDSPQPFDNEELVLYNLFNRKSPVAKGSHKYQGEWSQLDQIIVSTNLLSGSNGLSVDLDGAQVFSPPFLLKPDATWGGTRPKRTYYGIKYEGGTSDHLPITLKIDFLNQTDDIESTHAD